MRAGRVYLTSNPKIILEQIIKQLICKRTNGKKIMLKIVIIIKPTQTKKPTHSFAKAAHQANLIIF